MNQTLPFTDFYFLGYILLSVLLVWGLKLFGKNKVEFKYVVAALSLVYIGLLFTKPIHLLGLVLYLYFMVKALRKYYHSDNLVLPMLLLSLPMLLMKLVGVLPSGEGKNAITDARFILQVAGISYMVFRVIGLYIDKRQDKNSIKIIEFFNFTTFVPSLLIGPIDRFERFQKDVANAFQNITKDNVLKGLDELLKGVLFKFILSVAISKFVMHNIDLTDGWYWHIAYMYSYLFYLFFDFAGYCLLAIGFARLIGIDLPRNFDKPFLAKNPKEFWKHWHKSLGDWLNDYFFKPLFKFFTTKQWLDGPKRQGLALFTTFLLMGFWNGFELHYIISGALFGLYSVVHNAYTIQCRKKKKDVVFGNLNPKLISFLSIFIMFNIVAFAIYVFSGNLS